MYVYAYKPTEVEVLYQIASKFHGDHQAARILPREAVSFIVLAMNSRD